MLYPSQTPSFARAAFVAALLSATSLPQALAQTTPAPEPTQPANPLDWVLRPSTAAAAPAESCPLRPARVGVVKLGLAGAQIWNPSTGLAVPLLLGYEHRLLPNTTMLANIVTVYDPWKNTLADAPTPPSLPRFDITTGIRYYLPVGKYRRGEGEEFAGAYVSLLNNRSFRTKLQTEPSGAYSYSYRMQRSTALMAGYQLPIGGRGFLDVSAGLRAVRATSSTARTFEPAIGATFGLFY